MANVRPGTYVDTGRYQRAPARADADLSAGQSRCRIHAGALFEPRRWRAEKRGLWQDAGPASASRRIRQLVFGTPNRVDAICASACGGCKLDPALQSAPQPGISGWTRTAPPPEMAIGPAQAVTVFDGTNYIILTANWRGGIWRFIERPGPAGLERATTGFKLAVRSKARHCPGVVFSSSRGARAWKLLTGSWRAAALDARYRRQCGPLCANRARRSPSPTRIALPVADGAHAPRQRIAD